MYVFVGQKSLYIMEDTGDKVCVVNLVFLEKIAHLRDPALRRTFRRNGLARREQNILMTYCHQTVK